MAEILPSSLLREQKGRVFRGGVSWIPIFCANCGVPAGYMPEADLRYASWWCQKPECEKAAIQTGDCLIPDAVFWRRWTEACLERWGRAPTKAEFEEATTNVDDPLNKLVREF